MRLNRPSASFKRNELSSTYGIIASTSFQVLMGTYLGFFHFLGNFENSLKEGNERKRDIKTLWRSLGLPPKGLEMP